MIVPVMGFESEASLETLAVVSGTSCSMSALPNAFENTILLFEAMATESPGHFVATNRALMSDSRRCGSDTELLWARALEQMKSDSVREDARTSIFRCNRVLAVGAESITIETRLGRNRKISRFFLIEGRFGSLKSLQKETIGGGWKRRDV